jgi:hypothetical protein
MNDSNSLYTSVEEIGLSVIKNEVSRKNCVEIEPGAENADRHSDPRRQV